MSKSATLGLAGLLALLGMVQTPRAQADPVIFASTGEGVTTDLLDVSLGAIVTANSAMGFNAGIGSVPQAALGATSSFVEPTHTIFENDAAPGSTDFITFNTTAPISLLSYQLRLADDSGTTMFPDRGSISVKLFGGTTSGSLSLLSQGTILSNYKNNYGNNQIMVTDAVNGVGLQFFRLEVTRATTQGPRIIELDGFAVVPEPSSLVLAGMGLAAVAMGWVRRRRPTTI